MNEMIFLAKVELKDSDLKMKVKKFSLDCTETTYAFNSANGSTSDKLKLINDRYHATMAEWAVWKHLTNKGLVLDKPDMVVYEKNQKKHGPDLSINGIGLSIKSQTISAIRHYKEMSFMTMKWAYAGQVDSLVFYVVCNLDDSYSIFSVGRFGDLIKSSPRSVRAQQTKDAFYLKIKE